MYIWGIYMNNRDGDILQPEQNLIIYRSLGPRGTQEMPHI